jgi:hypothetical protein
MIEPDIASAHAARRSRDAQRSTRCFLAFGAILVGLGWAMVQAGQREATFAGTR